MSFGLEFSTIQSSAASNIPGTTTIGTQAAVEYVSRENYLNELLSKMNVSRPGELKPFEAVIQVKVAKGVPVESSLVALRVLN